MNITNFWLTLKAFMSHINPTQASTFISAWTPSVFFKGNLQRRQNVKKLFRSDKIGSDVKKAPGMANLVSLCLCQGEWTAVGFSLVDQSSNHIDVIIRDLNKN